MWDLNGLEEGWIGKERWVRKGVFSEGEEEAYGVGLKVGEG